jgi:hypothetical protein
MSEKNDQEDVRGDMDNPETGSEETSKGMENMLKWYLKVEEIDGQGKVEKLEGHVKDGLHTVWEGDGIG